MIKNINIGLVDGVSCKIEIESDLNVLHIFTSDDFGTMEVRLKGFNSEYLYNKGFEIDIGSTIDTTINVVPDNEKLNNEFINDTMILDLVYCSHNIELLTNSGDKLDKILYTRIRVLKSIMNLITKPNINISFNYESLLIRSFKNRINIINNDSILINLLHKIFR